MIVKVQLSLESNAPGHKPGASILVYNKSRSIMFEIDADQSVVDKMKGRLKELFHAEKVEKSDPKSKIKIGELAPWQDW